MSSAILRNFLFVILIFISLHTSAQSIITEFDKKIINTDSLNLPSNTTASTIISLLPELLQRPGTYILSNYDIQVEGMSVGSTADVVLNGLLIKDITKVEVSESPISSYQKNGQGGSINFIMRPQPTDNSRPWGSISMSTSYPLDLAPQANIGFVKDKFMIRGLLLGKLSNTTQDSQTILYDNDTFRSLTNHSDRTKFRTELARAYMQYDISSRDNLTLNVSQIHTNNRLTAITGFDNDESSYQRKSSTDLQALLRYRHKTPGTLLTAQFEYRYSPSTNYYSLTDRYISDNETKNNVLLGKLEYQLTLYKAKAAKQFPDYMRTEGKLTLGLNFNASFKDETISINDHNIVGNDFTTYTPQNDTRYIMPYITFNTTLRKLHLKATCEYQYFCYDYQHNNASYTTISKDITAKVMSQYYFSPDNSLRLVLDRKLQRPEPEQLYPYRIFNPTRYEYVEGNPLLRPMMVHEVMLDYIATYRWQLLHSLTINAGASINSVSDIITSIYPGSSESSGLGSSLRYATFQNIGSSKVASLNLMALYSYKAFSLSFTGNLYHKTLESDDPHNSFSYFNLSIYPHFTLTDGWHGGARLIYYSRMHTPEGSLADCAVAEITIGKAWKKFFVFFTEKVAMKSHATDITNKKTQRTEKNYQMVPNRFILGLSYSF